MSESGQLQGSFRGNQPRFCSKCGGDLAMHGAYCPGCGSPTPADKNFCAACGHKLNETGPYCQHCGEQLPSRVAGASQSTPSSDCGVAAQPPRSSFSAGKETGRSIEPSSIASAVAGVIAALAASASWLKVSYGLVLLGNISSNSIKSEYSLFDLFNLGLTLTNSSQGSSSSDLQLIFAFSVVVGIMWLGIVGASIGGVVTCFRGGTGESHWSLVAFLVVTAALLTYGAVTLANDGAEYFTVTGMPIASSVFAIAAAAIYPLSKKR